MIINKNLTPPCRQCLERKQLCHDSCDRYKQFKENKANVQAARNEFLNEKNVIVESVQRAKHK